VTLQFPSVDRAEHRVPLRAHGANATSDDKSLDTLRSAGPVSCTTLSVRAARGSESAWRGAGRRDRAAYISAHARYCVRVGRSWHANLLCG